MRILSSLSRNENIDKGITRERNKIASTAYMLMQIIAIISIPIVIITNMPWYNFFTAFIVLIVCNLFLLIKFKMNSLSSKDLFNKNDESICFIKNKFFNEAYNLGFFIILMTVGFTNIFFYLPIHIHISQGLLASFSFINLITIIVPGIYSLFMLIKKGLKVSEISVPKENKNTNLKKLKITCLFGGIFFGVFMGIGALNHTNIKIAVIEGILGGAFFGISFYIIEGLLIKKSEKNSIKKK